jgi:transposase-like protein
VQYPSDVTALVVLWRLRYRLTLRDLSEMFLERGCPPSGLMRQIWGVEEGRISG